MSLFISLLGGRERLVSTVFSVLVHSTILLKGGQALVAAPVYGVQRGDSIEVHMLAAPLSASQSEAEIQPMDEPAIMQVSQSEVVQLNKKQKDPKKKDKKRKVLLRTDKPSQGDGSSAVAGVSKTTAQSAGGAMTEAQPNYLTNPPPMYPMRARNLGQQGVVSLIVEVDRDGEVKSVSMKQSSGYFLLDDAAVKAVRHWKFLPATEGGSQVESVVEVPIRFKIELAKSSG